MKVFIDFDDVIFNTKKFSIDLKLFFNDNGVSDDLFRKHYYAPGDDNPVKLFDPNGLFLRLEEKEKIDATKLRNDFTKHIKNLSSFVFDDVFDFLGDIGKENVFIISFGLPSFQNEKIIGAGVNKFVNGCIVTSGSKAEAIRQVMAEMKISEDEKFVFIDDRIEQIQDIKIAFPNALTFLLSRNDGRYNDSQNEYCDYSVTNLKEVHRIII